MFSKVLIANRGEIAIRIMRACKEMGIATVAVYSEADRDALHPALADETVYIGPAPAVESYLNVERIVAAAKQTRSQAIHPGYGFLAENAEFAQAVSDAGLTFIGPSPDAIRAMGSKTNARALMEKAGVPIVPGYTPNVIASDPCVTSRRAGAKQSPRHSEIASSHPSTPTSTGSVSAQDAPRNDDFHIAAERLGYPVLVKAAAGGGGKGMRVVERADDLQDALDAARREALNAFGDSSIYIEKLLLSPRHIEFQVLADQHGHSVHLLERDCSIQRRHQKIIEETPSPFLDPSTALDQRRSGQALRGRMGEAAVSAARAVGYTNAGTIEFLVDGDRNFYFLEMNTRLQVEHPITEAITGIDLVKAQIRIAADEPLWLTQDDVRARGHAVECRIYAEDPANNFLPSVGKVLLADEPHGPGVRVDAAIATGKEVSRFYDPLVAKVITHAETRAEAIARMDRALSEYVILGVTTNIRFLRDVLAHEVFQRGEATTHFVDEHFTNWLPRVAAIPDEVWIAAALSEAQARAPTTLAVSDGDAFNPWLAIDGFRVGIQDPKDFGNS